MRKIVLMVAGLIIVYLGSYGFTLTGLENFLSLFRIKLPENLAFNTSGILTKLQKAMQWSKDSAMDSLSA